MGSGRSGTKDLLTEHLRNIQHSTRNVQCGTKTEVLVLKITLALIQSSPVSCRNSSLLVRINKEFIV